MSQRTKRLDIRIKERFSILTTDSAQKHVVENCLTVLKTCGALNSLTLQLPLDVVVTKPHLLEEALCAFSTSLRVLRLHWPDTMDLHEFLPKLSALRVWDLSAFCPYRAGRGPVYEFPNVHTISGPLNIICQGLIESKFPSLRRIICNHVYRESLSNVTDFLGVHGHQLRRLELYVLDVCDEMIARCPNLVDVVIHFESADVFSSPLLNLETIGFLGAGREGGGSLEMMIYAFESVVDALERTHLPKLKKIRILDGTFAETIRRKKMNALKLYDRRFRGRSVELEDAYGNRIVVLHG